LDGDACLGIAINSVRLKACTLYGRGKHVIIAGIKCAPIKWLYYEAALHDSPRVLGSSDLFPVCGIIATSSPEAHPDEAEFVRLVQKRGQVNFFSKTGSENGVRFIFSERKGVRDNFGAATGVVKLSPFKGVPQSRAISL